MKFEDFKAEFDSAFAKVTDDELVAEFAKMGCEIEIIPTLERELMQQISSAFTMKPEHLVGRSRCSLHERED